MRSLSVLLAALASCQAAFVAIDYGSEWMKASLMTPGRPIDVLLNTDSKRKIQSTVAWNKEERSFGSDAYNLASRFPRDSYSYLKYIQGCMCDGFRSKVYSDISPVELVKDDTRGTCSLRRPDGSLWGVEELIGMQFMYVKQLAEKESGERVTEAVVTVPPFYTQFERQAVLDALQIAGLKPIALINDGLAVAINYAMARPVTEEEHHIIYDAGASSITATLVTLSIVPIQTPGKILKSSKNATQIAVQSFGYDTVATGMELDLRLRDYLVKLFENRYRKGITNNQRAMSRLLKEAQRVKTVLTANAEATVRLESLMDDIDFKDVVTRSDFEMLAKDLLKRFSRPIVDALQGMNVTMNEVSSVIMTGGASRIPMIRSSVKDVAGDKLAVSVNADEAAVLGAAFYGATTKSTWRTKDMKFIDIQGAYDVQLKYRKENSDKELLTPVFSPRSKLGLGNGKKLTFLKRTQDFAVTVAYKNNIRSDFADSIMDVQFSGIPEALANLTKSEHELGQTQITATFAYTNSGMIVVDDAAVAADVKQFTVTEAGQSEIPDPEAAQSPLSDGNSTNETVAKASKTPEIPTNVVIPLKISVTPLSIPPMTSDAKAAAHSRLTNILKAEAAKTRQEEAYNKLEGYLYRLRDLIEGDDSTPFKQFVQPAELQQLSKGLSETLTWLNDDGHNADESTLWKKRNTLESVEQPVITRYKEAEAGPKALNNLQKAHTLARAFIEEANANRTEAIEAGVDPRFTEDDLMPIEALLNESEEWLKETMAKQMKLEKRANPILRAEDMDERGVALQKYVKGLERRKPYRPPRPSATPTPAPSEEADSPQDQSGNGSKHPRDEF